MSQIANRFVFVFVLALIVTSCGAEPAPVEVTRIVSQEVPVTVEVTREVIEVVVTEAPVTRVVEVVVTPTPEQTVDETATAAPPEQPEIPPTAVNEPVSNVYTVESGDNLSIIAGKTGVLIGDILAANNLTRESVLAVGQRLTIPDWDGQIRLDVAAQASAPAAPAASEPETETAQTLVPVGPNLLPNPSFEGNWYFFQNVSEWQISEGWSLFIDEGPNNYESGAGGVFFRPEVRVVSKANLPPEEHALFVFSGEKTVKVFKGGAPTHFALYTDVVLPPGDYRFTIRFFADAVAAYEQGRKVWATHPLAAEVRFVENGGGSGWIPVMPGQQGALSYDFTVAEEGSVRIGAEFLNRLVNHNNGWFLDDWMLQRLGTP